MLRALIFDLSFELSNFYNTKFIKSLLFCNVLLPPIIEIWYNLEKRKNTKISRPYTSLTCATLRIEPLKNFKPTNTLAQVSSSIFLLVSVQRYFSYRLIDILINFKNKQILYLTDRADILWFYAKNSVYFCGWFARIYRIASHSIE